MFTIAVGDPWSGITLHGVFNSTDEASEYAFDNFRKEEYWIVYINQ